jgi:DNA-binding NarL/FixJ family response regulator
MAKVLVACLDDLFFRSKIEATARHLNVPVRFTDAKHLAEMCRDGSCAAILLDLSANGEPVEAIRSLRADAATRDLPIVGFLSHVDRELAHRAEAAGATRVMPRSQFTETLPDLMMDLLAPGTKRQIPEEPELPDE